MRVALLLALCACGERTQQPAPAPEPVASGAAVTDAATGVRPLWLVDITPLLPRPELVAHGPVAVGNRVIIAGSRTDYRGLDLATGAEAWHRPGGASLSAPSVVGPTDVILVHECDGAVGAPLGRGVLACFDWIDPIDISARKAGRIHAAEEKLGDCTSRGGAWKILSTNPHSLGMLRDACLFDADLRTGAASRLGDPPPRPEDPDDVVARIDGAAWRQVVSGGKSTVVRDHDGPSLPGLTVLGGVHHLSRGAAVVRSDSSLVHDYLAVYDGDAVAWTWPLPAPPDPAGRGGPVGVSFDDDSVFVFFDGGRVARFTAPWAGTTAP